MKLLKQQKRTFDVFKSFVDSNELSMVIGGPGGSGKSFLTKTMVNHVLNLGLKPVLYVPQTRHWMYVENILNTKI